MRRPDEFRPVEGVVVALADPGAGITSPRGPGLEGLPLSAASSRGLAKSGLVLRWRADLPADSVAVSAWMSKRGDVRIPTDRLLVRFHPKSPPARNRAMLGDCGVEIVHEFPGGRLFSVRTPATRDAPKDAWVDRLKAVSSVRSARPVWRYPAPGRTLPFNDPLLPDQWALRNTGQSGATPGADIDVFPVWKMGVTGKGVRVAVIDLAFDLAHEDLAEGFDLSVSGAFEEDYQNGGVIFTTPCPPKTNDSHGTNVAGVLGARADNGKGICGVAPDVTMVPIMVSTYCADDVFLRALYFAADPAAEIPSFAPLPRADLITSSIGWTVPLSDELHEALTALRSTHVVGKKRTGRLVVWAGPHTDATIESQTDGVAESDLVLTVGQSSDDDLRLPCGYGDHLDVLAPGDALLTTHPMDSEFGPYILESHTSVAAPVAAGVAALVLQVNPFLSAVALETLICKTCQQIGGSNANYDAGRDPKYGYGRVDAAAAVNKARAALLALRKRQWEAQLRRRRLRWRRRKIQVTPLDPPMPKQRGKFKSKSKAKTKSKTKKPAGKRKKPKRT